MLNITLTELRDKIRSGDIVAAVRLDGTRDRLFVSTGGAVCRFKKGSYRRGYQLDLYDLANYGELVGPPPPLSEEDQLKKQYRVIAKYKKMAAEATFTNPFIRDCLALPDFETWKHDLLPDDYWDVSRRGKQKSLYDYHVTTGTRIDGKVISLDRIAKKYPSEIERLRECIRTKTRSGLLGGLVVGWGRAKFDGYDVSIETDTTDDGDFMCYLSLEYAGCGNGYYYLLINDNNFIGYDID
ncbi:MAG: hypothetical protein ACK4S4_15655 [Pyrinomonadaceae bacterium]